MKNIALITALLLSSFGFSQDFQGMAVYESKTSSAEMMKAFSGNKEITPEMQKNIEERMKSMFEKTFILNFDKTASIYKEEEKLANPNANPNGRMMSSMMGGGGTLYKNVKTKTIVNDKEVFGKEFLIKDSLTSYSWKLENESKKIGQYTCYKATIVVPTESSDFRNIRFTGNKDEKTDATKKADSAKTKTTDFTKDWEMAKEKTITAWYTPEIPVNQGPESYWGLPGLILEVNDGKTIILCSKIVMNTKEKVEIKPATKGKVLTQKEFDETVTKKIEEMKEMYGGQRGNSGGGHRF